MNFRLLYEGPIAPRQRATLPDIHAIRKAFDPQVRELWQHLPLSAESEKLLKHPHEVPTNHIGILERRGTTVFAPLVTKRLELMCELEIVFLRKQAPGQLIGDGDGGDIDNRIKTLLDALSMPPLAQQRHFEDATSSSVIHCLLQDDSLVTKLSVETDRLLRPTESAHDLVAIIRARVAANLIVGEFPRTSTRSNVKLTSSPRSYWHRRT
ncbi:hypothetical protein [Bradyrhizobium uaiense]|uniref:Uncharacterized protein n=1 Tax=Bradyrhizobium uaiense TaxID=2594946 RepID=A0A6P1BWL1_9BRAD|nr:hypothetical protein [Bradyrhizobium uaiense]NEV01942.1 hypothetical protein [Bradyrhizobium uaiense]